MDDVKRFELLMYRMGAPKARQEGNEINASWFLRQGIMYYDHKNYLEARAIALKLVG